MSVEISITNHNDDSPNETPQSVSCYRFCVKRRYITVTVIVLSSTSLLYFVPADPSFPRLYWLSGLVGGLLILITCTFPRVVAALFERPYWYNDLMCYDDVEVSKKALSIFHVICTVGFGLLAVATFDYGVYEYNNKDMTVYECMGVVGGILSLFNMLLSLTGQIILFVVIWYCDREAERLRVIPENLTNASAIRSQT
tara:strand:+ start:31 stop:624 length:594 start_codon:yes stop_codon:yes gene_type:complete